MSVHRGRQDAREAGRASYLTEATLLDLPDPPDTHREQYDQDRSYAVGWSYGTFWRQQYARLGDGQKALDATESRLRMIGATEASEAMTDERDNIIRLVGEAQSKSGSLMLFKVWDATLDRNTCPRCEKTNGTVVPFFMNFPLGRPGGVHALCRCYEGTILLPFWFSRESEIAA